MSDVEIRKNNNGWKFVTARKFDNARHTDVIVDLNDPSNRTPDPKSRTLVYLYHFRPHQVMVTIDTESDLRYLSYRAAGHEFVGDKLRVDLRPVRSLDPEGNETSDAAEIVRVSTKEIFMVSHTAEPVTGIRKRSYRANVTLHKMRGRG